MNRQALLGSIDGFSKSLSELRQHIDQSEPQDLAEFFTIAKQFRDGIV